MTEMERLKKRLEYNARQAMTEDEILAEYVKDWLTSEKLRLMETGQRYYENDNDINYRKRLVIGEGGALTEDRTLNNRKVSHNFLRKLVDQKAQYLLGRPFSILSGNKDFASALNRVFDSSLRSVIRNLCKEAVIKGVSWLWVTAEDGELKFVKVPSEQVIPIRKRDDPFALEGVIRLYEGEEYQGRQKCRVSFAEYWNEKGVRFYRYENGALILDPFRQPQSHLTIDGKGYNFKRIPFIPFQYNEEELPLIRFIKGLIDDYDILKSEDSNTLLDDPSAILVLKNYDGTDLGEFRRNLSRYKAVKVSDNGGVTFERAQNLSQAVETHLSQTRKDIYELGRGVDTQSERLGQQSGVAMKFIYTDLDLDCSGIESQFSQSFAIMVEFIALFLTMRGEGEYTGEKAEILLNRDMVANEEEAISECAASLGLLSRETVIANHPWVTNVEDELSRIAAER